MKKFFFNCSLLAAGLLAIPFVAHASNGEIGNFENGPDGFSPAAEGPGYNSDRSLRLTNPTNGDASTKKVFNAKIFVGYNNLEMDVNLNGATILGGDASAIAFEQSGWKFVSLKDYVQNGVNGWQHVVIPLHNFPSLSQDAGVAWMNIRMWNNRSGSYDFDNVRLTTGNSGGGGGGNQTIPTPTNFRGMLTGPTEIELSWDGVTNEYRLYRFDEPTPITVIGRVFVDAGLSPNTEYSYRVAALYNGQESSLSNVVTIRTASAGGGNGGANQQIYPIANFENGPDGFSPSAVGPGYNSAASLKMVNPANGDASTRKIFNAPIFTNMNNVEFDINLNGAQLLGGDASAIAFEQAGWKYVSLSNYVQNNANGPADVAAGVNWQHVRIPLSDFPNLSQNSGVAWMNYRFWNNRPMEILLDNIYLSN